MDSAVQMVTGGDGDDLGKILDLDVLQEMLENSEDMEFRRLVRVQMRKLKKEKQENNEPAKSATKTSTSTSSSSYSSQQRYLPSTTQQHQPHLSNNFNTTSNTCNIAAKSTLTSSSKTPLIDNNRCSSLSATSCLDSVKLRAPPVNKDAKEVRAASSKIEPVVLRSVSKDLAPPSSRRELPSSTCEVVLKHVTANGDSSAGGSALNSSSVLRKKVAITPRQALKHFKQMDEEAILRNPKGVKDPLEAVKRTSRCMSPNNIKEQTLLWCKNRLAGYENVNIEDFSASWNDGLAFCAMASYFFPSAFDYDALGPKDRRRNFQLAFDTLEQKADIPPLLEVDDMVATRNPDWRCVFTYVNTVIARMAELRREEESNRRSQLLLAAEVGAAVDLV